MWDEKGRLSRSFGLETEISGYLQSDSEAGLSAGTIRNKGQRWVRCFTDNVSVACMVRDEFLISLPTKSSKVLALSRKHHETQEPYLYINKIDLFQSRR